jgi:7-cyano-7-deazaguanine synthase
MARLRSIILLSAGLDSAVNLQRAHQETDVALALTFDYGQLAAAKEIEAARAMCRRLDLRHRVLRLPWMREISKSALTREGRPLPHLRPDELDGKAAEESALAVWVPNRNGVFVNIAAAFAEALDCDLIVAGFNAEEGATFPDNSPEYIRAANRALRFSTLSRPKLISYTQDLDKVAIVRLGRKIGAPLDLIWSCYRSGDEHCWWCESCFRLQNALLASRSWSWFQRLRGFSE